MILFAYLPEIVAFIIFFLMSLQVPELGAMSVLGQMGAVALLLAFRPAAALETVLRWWPLLLMPIVAMASALWSDVPSASLRYGAQFLFTAFVGVHLARLLPPQRFLAIFLVAAFIFCALGVFANRYGPSFHGVVPIGLTGSKNAIGSAAALLLAAGVAILLSPGISRTMRWIGVLAIPLAAYFVIRAESATALAAAGASAAALCGLWVLQRVPAGGRLAVMIGAGIVLLPLGVLLPEGLAWLERFMTDTLDKDPTLTGRTILWAAADELAARRPLLGYGFQAIWMGDSSDSIGLHRLTGMTDGRSFHFHNQYLSIMVDLGLVGILPFVAGIVLAIGAGVRQFVLRPTMATSFFFVIFVIMVARGSLDQIVGPLSVQTVLFYASSVYAFAPVLQHAASPVPQGRRWERRARA